MIILARGGRSRGGAALSDTGRHIWQGWVHTWLVLQPQLPAGCQGLISALSGHFHRCLFVRGPAMAQVMLSLVNSSAARLGPGLLLARRLCRAQGSTPSHPLPTPPWGQGIHAAGKKLPSKLL